MLNVHALKQINSFSNLISYKKKINKIKCILQFFTLNMYEIKTWYA